MTADTSAKASDTSAEAADTDSMDLNLILEICVQIH
jgi:hypothetical protein